jgi:hypothetical protein
MSRMGIDSVMCRMYTEVTSEVLSFRRNRTPDGPSGSSGVSVYGPWACLSVSGEKEREKEMGDTPAAHVKGCVTTQWP